MLPRPVAAVRIERQAMYSAVYLEKFALMHDETHRQNKGWIEYASPTQKGGNTPHRIGIKTNTKLFVNLIDVLSLRLQLSIPFKISFIIKNNNE
jgi:hypothetical protein